jgi:hypothetical protein
LTAAWQLSEDRGLRHWNGIRVGILGAAAAELLVLLSSGLAAVARGTVRVKLPGSKRFDDLSEPQQLPVGTVVDTLRGRVTLVAAGGQTAPFTPASSRSVKAGARSLRRRSHSSKSSAAGRPERLSQRQRARRSAGCGATAAASFPTKGKHSAATVVGTKWLVEDRCTSTLTRVAKGRVSMRDFVKKKTVIVRPGKKYVARARR